MFGNSNFTAIETSWETPLFVNDVPLGVNRAQPRDSKGRYLGAQYYMESCQLTTEGVNDANLIYRQYLMASNRQTRDNTVPTCIFAFKTTPIGWRVNRAQWSPLVSHEVWQFVLCEWNDGNNFSYTNMDAISENYFGKVVNTTSKSKSDNTTSYGLLDDYNKNYQSVRLAGLTTQQFMNNINGSYLNSYDADNNIIFSTFTAETKNELDRLLENSFGDIFQKQFYMSPLSAYAVNPYNIAEWRGGYNNRIFCNVPIFIDVVHMYNYFSIGTTDGAQNMDDLLKSELDLRTDWIVYVRDARKPNIWVTMSSSGVDEFLESKENSSGLEKNNFTIEYRYPTYEKFFGSGESTKEFYKGTIDWKTDIYNNDLPTSYVELINLNYLNVNITDAPYTDDYAYSNLYAQLEFRIVLNDKIFSSWCGFSIGYIGSPSIEDFAKMDNWGKELSMSDGSTVTLVYDEYPPDYDPYPPIDDDDDIDTTLPTGTDIGLGLLTTSYLLTDDQCKQLGRYIWNDDIFTKSLKEINANPIENIVGLKIMPCKVLSTPDTVTIGNIDTKVNCDKITGVEIADIGSFKFEGYYKNFLDYAPYTLAYIFLPFIGFKELDTSQFTAHTLSVKYAFDIINGMCKAMLFRDNVYTISYEGKCGVDVPLIASNRAQVEAGLIAGGVTGVLETVASGGEGIVQAVGGIVNSMATAQFHSQREGTYSPTLGWAETEQCYILLIIPDGQYPASYAHDFGMPCMATYSLSQLSGFTVCSENIDMSGFSCTEEEKDMIKQLLTTGVYL